MPLPLQASTAASFGAVGSGLDGVQLEIENDPGSYSGGDEIHLLLFPAVGATLRASKGQVSGLGAPKPVRVAGGVITMSGTTASLPKRADVTVPVLEVMFAADRDGNEIDPGIVYDPANNTITAAVECTAAIAYSSYETLAIPFIYTPELSVGASVSGTGGSATVATFGTVVAFYPPDNITSYDVQPFALDDGDSLYEMYRITSNAITTIDGEFEKPPNFPTSGAYPDKALVLPTINFLETERVHEIGLMDLRGRFFSRQFAHPIREPYIGTPGYKPPSKEIKPSTLPAELFSADIILRAKNLIAQRGKMKL